MEKLPVEILENIFQCLDESDQNRCERVCSAWSHIIVTRFWWYKLQTQAREDYFLRDHLLREGWLFGGSIYETCRRLSNKIRSGSKVCWLTYPPVKKLVSLSSLKSWDFQRKKVIAMIIFQKKVFIVQMNGSLEMWTFDTNCIPRYKKQIYPETSLGLNLNQSLSINDNLLVFLDLDLQSVLLFNAETEDLMTKIEVTVDFREENVISVDINDRNVLLSTQASLYLWNYEVSSGSNQVTITYPCARISEDSSIIQTVAPCLNQNFLVYFAERGIIVIRFSKDGRYEAKKVITDDLSEQNILAAVLSKHDDKLAILVDYGYNHVLHYGSSQKTELKVVSLNTLKTTTILETPNSSLGKVNVPVQWIDNQLFYKEIPAKDSEDTGLKVLALSQNCEVEHSAKVAGVDMRLPTALMQISKFNVVYIDHHLERGRAVDEEPDIQTRLSYFDFWKSQPFEM